MPRPKRTIARDSVFRATANAAAPAPATRRAPPAEQPRFQTAVWLGEDEVEWLDSRCLEIRHSGWRSITRSALIRALIQASMENPVNFKGVADEEELKQRLGTPEMR